ncbi:MAG: hypothetical protein V3W20_13405 [Candidatus Neomarinimicrobiota bacterium]
MESLETISNLEIPIREIRYDKKSKLLSIDILGFAFVGHYKKSTKISEILDDIYSSLEKVRVERNNLCFMYDYNTPVPETKKLKDIYNVESIEIKEHAIRDVGKIGTKEDTTKDVEKKEEKQERRRDEAKESKKAKRRLVSVEEELAEDEEFDEGEILSDDISYLSKSKEEAAPKAQPAPPPPPASRGAPSSAPRERASEVLDMAPQQPSDGMGGAPEAEPAEMPMTPKAPMSPPAPSPVVTAVDLEEPKPTTYNINMGFQYYSVMMEQKSYLFYVYLSHEELKILDEEGKTVYKTTFTITTLKKEPPVLDLRIEGEGFDIHPLTGKIVVKKEAVNPPVMIFSVLPLKRMKKKKGRKKKSERRYLNVYIEFEEKLINHTVLSCIVQPKHFHLDLGPLQIDISKRTAFLISFISVLIATGSTIFSAITLETTSLVDIVGGYVPGLASFIFFAVFIITLIKNGIYPLKQKWSALLKFDKGIEMIK